MSNLKIGALGFFAYFSVISTAEARTAESCGDEPLVYECGYWSGKCYSVTKSDDCSVSYESASDECDDSTPCKDYCTTCGRTPESCGQPRFFYNCSGECRERYRMSDDCGTHYDRASSGCSSSTDCHTGCPDCHPSSGDCHASYDLGDTGYCTSSCPCEAGEADCGRDSDCASGLTCVFNVGDCFGFSSGKDVCFYDDIECTEDADCDDGDSSTTDRCDEPCSTDADCIHTPVIVPVDECAPSGYSECVSSTQFRYCQDWDSDGYLEWWILNCPSGNICSAGSCVLSCVDECSFGDKLCVDFVNYNYCEYNGSCWVWSTATQSCDSNGTYCATDGCRCNSGLTGPLSLCGSGSTYYSSEHTYDDFGASCWLLVTETCSSHEDCDETLGGCYCANECVYGNRECTDSTHFKICTVTSGCQYWDSTSYECPSGQVCSDGYCEIPAPTCINECSLGQVGCESSSERWYCGEAGDGDDCLEQVSETCPADSTTASMRCNADIKQIVETTTSWHCASGACAASVSEIVTFEHDCGREFRTINGSPICSPDESEVWQYWIVETYFCNPATGLCNSTLEDDIDVTACPSGEACVDGSCGCADECTPGDRGCLDSNTAWACGEAGDGDSCADILSLACLADSSYIAHYCAGNRSVEVEHTIQYSCNSSFGTCASSASDRLVSSSDCYFETRHDAGLPQCSPDDFEVWQYETVETGFCSSSSGLCSSMSGGDHRILSDCHGTSSRVEPLLECNDSSTATMSVTHNQEGYCDSPLAYCAWRDIGSPHYAVVDNCVFPEQCVGGGSSDARCEMTISPELLCDLTAAGWENTEAYDNEPIDMIVTTNSWCDGQVVHVEVLEDDPWWATDDPLPLEYKAIASGTVFSGILRIPWKARYQEAGDWFGSAEYTFVATYLSESVTSSNTLHVSPYRYPDRASNIRATLEAYPPEYPGACLDWGWSQMSNECLDELIAGGDVPENFAAISSELKEIAVELFWTLLIQCGPCVGSIALGIGEAALCGPSFGVACTAMPYTLGASMFLCDICVGEAAATAETTVSRQAAKQILENQIREHADEVVIEYASRGWSLMDDVRVSPTGALIRLRKGVDRSWVAILPEEGAVWRTGAKSFKNPWSEVDPTGYINLKIKLEEISVASITKHGPTREKLATLIADKRIVELAEEMAEQISEGTVRYSDSVSIIEFVYDIDAGITWGEYLHGSTGAATPIRLAVQTSHEASLSSVSASVPYIYNVYMSHNILPHELAHALFWKRLYNLGLRPISYSGTYPTSDSIKAAAIHEIFADGLSLRKLSGSNRVFKEQEFARELALMDIDAFSIFGTGSFSDAERGFWRQVEKIASARLGGREDLAARWLDYMPDVSSRAQVSDTADLILEAVDLAEDELFSSIGPGEALIDFLVCSGLIIGDCRGMWPRSIDTDWDDFILTMPETVFGMPGEIITFPILPSWWVESLECESSDGNEVTVEPGGDHFAATVISDSLGEFVISCVARDWLSREASADSVITVGPTEPSEVFWIELGGDWYLDRGDVARRLVSSSLPITEINCGHERLSGIRIGPSYYLEFDAQGITADLWSLEGTCTATSESGQTDHDDIKVWVGYGHPDEPDEFGSCGCSLAGAPGSSPWLSLLVVPFLLLIRRFFS